MLIVRIRVFIVLPLPAAWCQLFSHCQSAGFATFETEPERSGAGPSITGRPQGTFMHISQQANALKVITIIKDVFN